MSTEREAAAYHEKIAADILVPLAEGGWGYGDTFRLQVQNVARAQAHAMLAVSLRLADMEGPPA